VELKLHALTSAQEQGEWWATCSRCFIQWKDSLVPTVWTEKPVDVVVKIKVPAPDLAIQPIAVTLLSYPNIWIKIKSWSKTKLPQDIIHTFNNWNIICHYIQRFWETNYIYIITLFDLFNNFKSNFFKQYGIYKHPLTLAVSMSGQTTCW
jgi:hypothetical protein